MTKLKQFKAESQKVLDLMIHSIYTNQEIFLRELISNASDAMDKLYVQSLGDNKISFNKEDLKIEVRVNKDLRTISIKDFGIGMTKEELETNLGTIAHSDSGAFKKAIEDDIADEDIIGQFGVGFYSGFMVAKEMHVLSKSEQEETANVFMSKGADGYSINKVDKSDRGTEVVLYLKENTDDVNFDEYLDEFKIKQLVKKYSDYIRYPIVMKNEEGETETLNSMIPLWKRAKSEITQEEYDEFYKSRFNDYEAPLKTIHMQVEGSLSFNALLFIPNHAPFNYYQSDFKKGLELYSRSVFIQDHNEALIADHFGFVKGVVDSADLNLNISREVLQNDRQLKAIANRINRKVKSELELLLKNDREKYEEFYKEFGMQLKFGVYNHFGQNKDELKDLLLFTSTYEDKLVTLAEYVSRMKENQKEIYYVPGESILKARQLPVVETLLDAEYEVLIFMDDIDEFAIRIMNSYEDKEFKAANQSDLEIDESKKEVLEKLTEDNRTLIDKLSEALKDKVSDVRLTSRLKTHPVCLVSGEGLSFEMEKVLAMNPDESQRMKAERILEINPEHLLFETLQKVKEDRIADYASLLYDQALLIEGLPIENPVEFSKRLADLMIEANR